MYTTDTELNRFLRSFVRHSLILILFRIDQELEKAVDDLIIRGFCSHKGRFVPMAMSKLLISDERIYSSGTNLREFTTGK